MWSAHENFRNEREFKDTLKDAQDYSIYHCCFCKYSSKRRLNVEEHLSEEHYEEFDKEEYNESTSHNSSSPDSLEELVLPENRPRLLEINKMQLNERRPANDPSFRFRCFRCKKRFSRKHWLKDHAIKCIRQNNINGEETSDEPPKKRVFAVNGFYRCPHLKCSQVYTNKILFDHHLHS